MTVMRMPSSKAADITANSSAYSFSGQLLHPANVQRLGAHGAPDIQASKGRVDSVLHVGSEQHGGFAAAEPGPESFRHHAQRRVTHASVDTPLHTLCCQLARRSMCWSVAWQGLGKNVGPAFGEACCQA